MMAPVPDYDDTDMTNEEFEEAFARAEPVEVLATPSVSMAWSEQWGWTTGAAANRGVPLTVKTGGEVMYAISLAPSVSTGDRQPATV
jgi:hypothetical protein